MHCLSGDDLSLDSLKVGGDGLILLVSKGSLKLSRRNIMPWFAKGIFTGLVFFAVFTVIYLRGFYSSTPGTAMSIGVLVGAVMRPLLWIVLVLMMVTASLCFKLLLR
jgi:hypothetical protein